MKTPKEWVEEELSGEPLTQESVIEVIKMIQEETIEETCKVCAEKADAKIITEWSGNTGSEYCDDYAVVDKQSILNCAELLKKEL